MLSISVNDLLVVTLPSDVSGKQFTVAAERLGVSHKSLSYSELSHLVALDLLEVDTTASLLARLPFYVNDMQRIYAGVLQTLLLQESFERVFDGKLWQQDYLALTDKLMKVSVLKSLDLPVPLMIDPTQPRFPLIAKKRMGSRAAGNYLIENRKNWIEFSESMVQSDFIFQVFHPLKGDYRVLVLGEDVLGVVERSVSFKEDGRVCVEVDTETSLPNELLEASVRVAKYLGTDFCGIDIGLKEDGEYFFIEYNFNPQFKGFERVTGLSVAEKVIKFLMKA